MEAERDSSRWDAGDVVSLVFIGGLTLAALVGVTFVGLTELEKAKHPAPASRPTESR